MRADEVFISTDLVEAGRRTDFWREVTRPVFEASHFPEDRDRPLEGSIRSRRVGSLLIVTTSFNRQRYKRDRRTILQGGLDYFFVQVLTSGTVTGDFDGVDVSAKPGDILIQDLAQPLKGQVEAGSRLTLAVPRRDLDKAVGWRNLHGVVLKAPWPMTRLITVYLGELSSLQEPLSETQASAVQDAIVALLSAALGVDEPNNSADPSLNAALRQRILEFIDQNIDLPELSPEFLSRRFNVSRSHLYRAFAADRGVSKVLWDKRLDAAYLELTRTDKSSRSIADIAYALGFSSGNQFLRSFRARFGMAPSEARHERLFPDHAGRRVADLQSHFAGLIERTFKPTDG